MGGRGSSSGVSVSGKKYGTEYHTVLQSGNIKFVKQNDTTASVKTPMETMTKNRVYVTVNHKNELKAITYYDKENKRKRQIDLIGHAHKINGIMTIPHTHEGYIHKENGTRNLTDKERKMVARVTKLWDNFISK